ncbi:regulatory protein RecX [Pseudidiomarina homiensis]|uniref:regulatory protein RecX n=1 Tax=Pseudidiomarina homiensis TaxID=364198 RepID=UPI00215B4503|nr:recombination regulator RecX [Pseudidiomarina homiensis]
MTQAEEQIQADEVVVRLLGRREHSALELKQKLRQRGFSNAVIEQALAKAQEHGWQSDQRYTEIWLRQALLGGNGWLKIKAQAATKGIDEELLQSTLAKENPDWRELCYERLCKKFGEQPPQTPKERDKIMRHLLNRGFRFDEIKAALAMQSDAFAD